MRTFYEHFECSVIVENTLTESFPVKSGVRQGCILSPTLFLVVIDWVMRKTTPDSPRGIQWTLFSCLKDFDFADYLAVISASHNRHNHLQEKSNRLSNFAKRTGLLINQKKTKVMFVNAPTASPITISGEALECTENFTYLGSLISDDSDAHKDIQARLNIARGAFSRLRKILKSKQYSLKNKIRLYDSKVKAVLLYGSECWRITKGDMRIETLMSFITAASVRSVISIGPIRFIMCTCIRRQTYEYVPRDQKSQTTLTHVGSVIYLGCPKTEYPKLP